MLDQYRRVENIITLLIEKGAKKELKSKDGETPLQIAEKNGVKAIVERLRK